MSVMNIRIVGVPVDHGKVTMPVRMRFAGRVLRRMRMPVMRVVDVSMLMLQRFMFMLVLMPLCEMQVYADAHEHGGNQ